MFEIVNVGFKLDFKKFYDIVDSNVTAMEQRTGDNLTFDFKDAHTTSGRQSMYKGTITNSDSGEEIMFVAEHIGNDISFKPFELKNMNKSFYTGSIGNHTLCELFINVLREGALKGKGNFGCISDNQYIMVQDGKDISSKIKGIAFIDTSNKIYSLKSEPMEQEEEDDDVMGHIPKYLINDWLDEFPSFKGKLQSVPQDQSFDMMAQFIIYQKRHDMVDASQFRDIMLQVGTFAEMVGGFKDNMVKDIYQLLV